MSLEKSGGQWFSHLEQALKYLVLCLGLLTV